MSSSPLRSMTGFARARRPWGQGELTVSVKSVNHRGLDIHIRGPESVDPFEAAIRACVKTALARGHVEVRIGFGQAGSESGGLALNRKLMEAYLNAFREASAAHALTAPPDLNAALRIPGMLAAGEENLPPNAESALLDALAEALRELNVFREREGSEIGVELRHHCAQTAAAAAEMERIREGATAAFQKRLSERLSELLKGVQIEPQRLAQEAAILSDRSDIGEELARLKIHCAQLAALLDQGGEVGKKLDFLLQEMNREANTILSKTGGVGEAG